jgi:hypothetical protein
MGGFLNERCKAGARAMSGDKDISCLRAALRRYASFIRGHGCAVDAFAAVGFQPGLNQPWRQIRPERI